MAVKFSNNGKTTLASNITSSATSISVADGSVFPTLSGGDTFFMTLEDTGGNMEIVSVTARSGNSLTITRAQESTTARAFSAGDKAENRLTAAGLNSFVSDSGDTMTGNLSFGDNDKAIFGAGSDLQILHDGTNSVIRDNGSGNLSLSTNGSKIGFYDQANSQFLAEAFTGAGFRLYYDGSQKFVTQPNGIDVTGAITADGMTIDGGDVTVNGEYKDNVFMVDYDTGRVGVNLGSGVTPAVPLNVAGTVRFQSTSSSSDHLEFTNYSGVSKLYRPNGNLELQGGNTGNGILQLSNSGGFTFDGNNVFHAGNLDSILDLGITDGSNGQALKTDGAGNFSFGDVATSTAWADITSKPTTISGFGITDAFDGAYSSLTGTPTIPTNNNQLTNGAGYITSADGGNADTLDGYHAEGSSGNRWGIIPAVNSAGVMEIGRYIDFHASDGSTEDYRVRLDGGTSGQLYLSGNAIWHAGNDGSGSGLDADTLDGSHASSFAPAGGSLSTNWNANKLIADAGANIVSTSANPFRWQRSSTSQTGQDDNITVHVDDSNIYFTHNNDSDGDASGYNFRYTAGGSAVNLLNFNSGSISYRGNAIWHAGNDGSGSGLDADTVDGVHESTFMRRSANSGLDMNGYDITDVDSVHTQAESKEVKFAVYSGSTYGIGMVSGITYGGLNDWAMTFCMNNESDRGFWWGYSGQTKSTGAMSLTTAGVLTVASSITAGGNITAYSDERLKSDIETLDGSKVYKMRGVSFTKDGQAGSGVVAQELQKVAPELVKEGDEYLSVAYGNVVGYLIEAIKELKTEVDDLKTQLAEKG